MDERNDISWGRKSNVAAALQNTVVLGITMYSLRHKTDPSVIATITTAITAATG